MLHAAITERIIGAFHDVYVDKGYGFLESVYQNSLVVELGSRGLSVKREVATEVLYRGVRVGLFRADLVVEDLVLVEVKASKALTDADERQLLNYLKATSLEVGLLLHFGPAPRVLRRVYTNDRKR